MLLKKETYFIGQKSQRNPTSTDSLDPCEEAHRQLAEGDYEAARESYQKALELGQNSEEARTGLDLIIDILLIKGNIKLENQTKMEEK